VQENNAMKQFTDHKEFRFAREILSKQKEKKENENKDKRGNKIRKLVVLKVFLFLLKEQLCTLI